MPHDIWVAGFPSSYGGADTELDHLIDLLAGNGCRVHLTPMFGVELSMQRSVLERGCSIHEYCPEVFKDKVVISFCNGEFLSRLPEIMAHGRPRAVVWFNCMTYLFEPERRAHELGWIDYFGFVSEYQEGILGPQLDAIRKYRSFAYRPFFNTRRVEWRYREWQGTYRVGRISRDDGNRFAADTWRIFDRILVPGSLRKKIYILGYGNNAAAKIGPAPPGLDWQTWYPNEIPATEFYRTIDTMLHKTGGSRESYCRVLIEAYAHGVVPIVEADFAFPELVVHGETGFTGFDSDELSYFASYLAMNPREHRRVAENGRAHVEKLVDPDACWKAWAEGPLADLDSRPAA